MYVWRPEPTSYMYIYTRNLTSYNEYDDHDFSLDRFGVYDSNLGVPDRSNSSPTNYCNIARFNNGKLHTVSNI